MTLWVPRLLPQPLITSQFHGLQNRAIGCWTLTRTGCGEVLKHRLDTNEVTDLLLDVGDLHPGSMTDLAAVRIRLYAESKQLFDFVQRKAEFLCPLNEPDALDIVAGVG